jgi:Cellulose biosynthesis protein BcsS
VLVAPNGLDDDGLLFKLLISGGLYRYNSGYLREEVVGAEWLGQALAGWRVKRHGLEMKFFFGSDWERHKLWPDDPGSRLRGRRSRVRMAAEFWTEPMANTMLAGELSLSSIATNATARLATGWRLLESLFEDGVYVGREVQYFGSDGCRHTRFGAHLTGLKTDTYEWSAPARGGGIPTGSRAPTCGST